MGCVPRIQKMTLKEERKEVPILQNLRQERFRAPSFGKQTGLRWRSDGGEEPYGAEREGEGEEPEGLEELRVRS